MAIRTDKDRLDYLERKGTSEITFYDADEWFIGEPDDPDGTGLTLRDAIDDAIAREGK